MEQKKIMQLYAAFGAALLLSLIPMGEAAAASLILSTGALFAAYALRKRADEESLISNHATFIIRTIWIGSLLAVVTSAVGGAYLFTGLDNTPLDPCLGDIGASTPTMDSMANAIAECQSAYMEANFSTFLTAGIAIAGPVLAYFVVRFVRGLLRAMKGYRVANPKSWL